ncbi:MAG: competence/damage-inducible protein A [Anaerolineaceae bacterium]|nr:MAG: competence/damage-inducible protein A [Anaerolineaceae bacterium]
MPSAEIITIGTEILLGEIVDTNTRFLARALRGLGVDLFRTITIGDNVQRIAEAIQDSLCRADIVITTGGLGPTVDDPTREAVARAAGVETEFCEELWEQVKAVIARYGRTPGENQKRQAVVPRGAIAIQNPVGTAPAFIVESPLRLLPNSTDLGEVSRRDEGGQAIISLPGVPQEMEYLFHNSVVPYLQKHFDLRDIIKVRLLHTSGLGEGMIDEKIGELETLTNPTVGLAAHAGVVDVRITAKAQSEAEADRLIAEVETVVRERLGNAVFGVDEDTLEKVSFDAAASRGWNLAALESGLDGRLARALSAAQPPNLLTVESAALQPGELAARTRQVRERSGAKAALGVALFRRESEQVIELYLILPDDEKSRRLTYGGPPNYSPRWAVNMALNWLRLAAEGNK